MLHVPLASVTESVLFDTEQPVEPLALKVTAPLVVPPVVLSVAVFPKVTGLGVASAVSAAWLALSTVSALLPLLDAKLESPAKLAPTPVGYVPALIPDKLTLVRVATPLLFVVAVPTDVLLSLKLMVLPFTPDPLEVSVA